MMASYDWRVRHAGLMAIAAIGEGTGKVCNRFTFFEFKFSRGVQLPSISISIGGLASEWR